MKGDRRIEIRYAVGELAVAVDALRDTLAAVAGPELVTRYANPQKWNSYAYGDRRHVYWQVASSTSWRWQRCCSS
jgi:hypothetical protein